MRDGPRVTVVAVCYNHRRFLEECLNGIAAQSYPNLQLIVADDSSSDGSPELIRSWLEAHWPAATFIEHAVNRGLCATLNEALAQATGEFVALISTDDLMDAGRLTAQVEWLERCPESVAVAYSDATLIDEDGTVLPATYGELNWWFDRPPEGDVFEDLLRLNFIPAVSALIRRSAIEEVGGYDESILFEDWDMWLRLAAAYDFVYSPGPLTRHRLVSSSLYHTRRIEMAESKIRLLSKWLEVDQHRSKVVGRARQEVHYIYEHDRRASLPHLRMLCDQQGGARAWGRYVLARLGMSYRMEQKLARLVSRTVSRARP